MIFRLWWREPSYRCFEGWKNLNTKKTAFTVLIILTAVFIWSNSFKSGTASMNSSNGFKQIILDFFKSAGIDLENSFLIEYIRKFAHFAEYFVLGSELFLFRHFYLEKNISSLLNITYIGAFTAFSDETIQLIPSLERSAEVADVWIDIFGIILAFSVLKIIFYSVSVIKNKHKTLQK